MRFRKIIALCMAAAMTVSLAGCGSSSSTDTDTTQKTEDAAKTETEAGEQEQPEVAPGKKGTIEFWTVFTGADGTSMQAMVDAYNATNSDYTVNHRAIEANDLYLKMPLAIQSGEDVPDVCINHIERVPLFQEQGFLVDYTDYLADSPISKENYNPKAWEMTEIAGGHYGIPLDVHSYILYVNEDLYEKYGNGVLDDGTLIWEELESIGDACAADDIIPMGMAWLRVKFLASYAQLGGTLSTDGNTPDFNNDTAVKVLDNWVKLREEGYTHKEGDDPWQLFLAGKMLFCPEGIWMYNDVKEAGLNARMYDYPVFDGGAKGNWTSSHQFVLPKNAFTARSGLGRRCSGAPAAMWNIGSPTGSLKTKPCRASALPLKSVLRRQITGKTGSLKLRCGSMASNAGPFFRRGISAQGEGATRQRYGHPAVHSTGCLPAGAYVVTDVTSMITEPGM